MAYRLLTISHMYCLSDHYLKGDQGENERGKGRMEKETYVTWTTKAGGKEFHRTGRVICVVNAGDNADQCVPNLENIPYSRIKYISAVSKYDRVLVAVPEGKHGDPDYYYAPKLSAVKKVQKESKKIMIDLPCEVGETVYFIDERKAKRKKAKRERFVNTGEVDHILIGWLMRPCVIVSTDCSCKGFDAEEFGVTIFRSKRDAEEALNE